MAWLLRVWWRLIRFGFQLLYNELAWTYDLVSTVVSLGRWRDWQRASIPYVEGTGGRVLELAHGTGNLQIDLAATGREAVGMDLSPHMGRIVQRKLRRRGIAPRLARGNARRLPFAAQSFGVVVSTFPTEFILHPDTLGEARRVLMPGGRLVVVFNGVLTLTSPPARALEWLYHATGQRGPWPGDPLGTLEAAGFDARLITAALRGSAVTLVVATRR